MDINVYKSLINEETNTMKSTDLHKFVHDATGKYKEINAFNKVMLKALFGVETFEKYASKLEGSEISGFTYGIVKTPTNKIDHVNLTEVECNMVMGYIDHRYLRQLAEVFVAVKNNLDQIVDASHKVQELEEIIDKVAPTSLFGEVSKSTGEPKTKLVRAYYKGDRASECNKIARDIKKLKDTLKSLESNLFGADEEYVLNTKKTIIEKQAELDKMLIDTKDGLTKKLEKRRNKLLKGDK